MNPWPNVSIYQPDKSLKKINLIEKLLDMCFWFLVHIHDEICLFCTVACSKKE